MSRDGYGNGMSFFEYEVQTDYIEPHYDMRRDVTLERVEADRGKTLLIGLTIIAVAFGTVLTVAIYKGTLAVCSSDSAPEAKSQMSDEELRSILLQRLNGQK